MIDIETHITPGERLRALRKRKGYETAEQLALRTGFKTSSVIHHENGTRKITPERAEVYAQALNVKPELILYGKGFNQDYENNGNFLTRKVALLTVPLLLSSDKAQFRLIAGGSRPMSDRTVFAPFDLPDGHRVLAVAMPDKSMEWAGAHAIYQGEPVYIDPDAVYGIGDIVAAELPDCADLLIRKYRRASVNADGKESFDLLALNSDYGVEKDIFDRGAVIVGKVIGVYRKF